MHRPSVASQTIQLGGSRLIISRLGLGCAPLAALDEQQAIAVVQHALSLGIRLLDTAPLYGAGRSEQRVGAALQGVPRDSFVISTKVGRRVIGQGEVVYDWSRDGIMRGIEESLARLQLDYVDILLIHDPDAVFQTALDVVYPILDDLRRQGMVRAIGAGMNQWEMERDFANAADFDCFLLAGRYTLLEQEAAGEFLPLCQARNIGLYLGGVLNSGILATGALPGATYNYAPAPPAIMERVRRLEQVCERHGVALHNAAMQFPLAHPAVTAVLVGARSPGEVDAAAAALATPLPAALWADLRAAQLLHPDVPTPADAD
jgi:D-threo-aldose 1-dehydrogenase